MVPSRGTHVAVAVAAVEKARLSRKISHAA
jgi:hypothetical protein